MKPQSRPTLIFPLKYVLHSIWTVTKTVAFSFDRKYTSTFDAREMLVMKPLVSLRM